MPIQKRKRTSLVSKKSTKSRRPAAKAHRSLTAGQAVSGRKKGRKITARRGSASLIKRAVSAMTR